MWRRIWLAQKRAIWNLHILWWSNLAVLKRDLYFRSLVLKLLDFHKSFFSDVLDRCWEMDHMLTSTILSELTWRWMVIDKASDSVYTVLTMKKAFTWLKDMIEIKKRFWVKWMSDIIISFRNLWAQVQRSGNRSNNVWIASLYTCHLSWKSGWRGE